MSATAEVWTKMWRAPWDVVFAFHEQNATEPFYVHRVEWPTAPPRLHEEVALDGTDDDRVDGEVFIVVRVRYHLREVDGRTRIEAWVKLWRAAWSERKVLDEAQPIEAEQAQP